MPDQNAYIEKRQFERIASRIKVTYQVIADAEVDRLVTTKAYQDISLGDAGASKDMKVKDIMTVVTENISMGGMMIVGDQPFKAGTSMNVEMTLPQTPVPLKCLAVVVRGSDAAVGGKYSAGLRFLAINKDDIAKIQRYIILQKRAELDRRS
jgi:c-di-GMP-binding flagellar brake protein YcgR